MFIKNLIINWLLIILTFTLINYNLYTLICSFSFINLINIHNFFYNVIYMYEISYVNIFTNYSLYINIYINQWSKDLINILNYDLKYNLFESIYSNFNFLLKILDSSDVYCVYFDTKVIGNNSLTFYTLQKKIFIIIGETTLCFFRIINSSDKNIFGIPIYIISPFEFSSFITKVQCFCFEEMFIFPYEIVELPVLFFLNSKVTSLAYSFINEFSIEYIFLSNDRLYA